VIDVLERTAPAGASDPPRAMQDLAERLGRRSLVVVVSDLFAPAAAIKTALARLRHGRHEVISLRVLDPDEIDFPFNSWLRLRGLEGEGLRLCEPALVRQQYLGKIHRPRAGVARCAPAGTLRSFTSSRLPRRSMRR
jgi:hypothetical protein